MSLCDLNGSWPRIRRIGIAETLPFSAKHSRWGRCKTTLEHSPSQQPVASKCRNAVQKISYVFYRRRCVNPVSVWNVSGRDEQGEESEREAGRWDETASTTMESMFPQSCTGRAETRNTAAHGVRYEEGGRGGGRRDDSEVWLRIY